MNPNDIVRKVDHTLLTPTATKQDIIFMIEEAKSFFAATVCIPPSLVKEAYAYADGKMVICTVIGFPLGYHTTKSKVFEAKEAVENGATEIDMVLNISWVKEGKWDEIIDEITQVKKVSPVLKVIIETSLLTKEEKIKCCEAVTAAKADFIKTSTGFSTGGATVEDVNLLKEHIGKEVKIKAAGGISSLEEATALLEAGADRLGSSKLIELTRKALYGG